MVPDSETETPEAGPRLADLPVAARMQVIYRSALKSGRERRTKRAFFFTSASLLVGYTVGGLPGVLACGFFGGSLYLVVLVVRMQRHLQEGAREYFAEQAGRDA